MSTMLLLLLATLLFGVGVEAQLGVQPLSKIGVFSLKADFSNFTSVNAYPTVIGLKVSLLGFNDFIMDWWI